MQYRENPKNGDSISALGFGCMRFHKDEKEVEKQIRYAIAQGVNYFDTAHIYPGSESLLGKILARDGLRERVNIATKLPQYLVKKPEDMGKLFSAELERLQTEYVDYYLMHMLSDEAGWNRLVALGVKDWIAQKKSKGQIRNVGFSFHGVHPEFIKLIDAYDWDFCMIQYNYLDENSQAGKAGLSYAAGKGIPVMVMEPLRGGTLVNDLPASAKALWDSAPVRRSFADWGLRWVLNHPQVLCVLSGMGTQDMVRENITIAAESLPDTLTAAELALYDQVCMKIRESTKVSCTACGYCMPCPKGVNIPMCFASLNDTVLKGRLISMFWYIAMAKDQGASQCMQCGKCEKHCPQAIPIRAKLQQTQKELEGFPYKPLRFMVRRVMRRG